MNPEEELPENDDELIALFSEKSEFETLHERGQAKLADGSIVDLDIEENQIKALEEDLNLWDSIPIPTRKSRLFCARMMIVDHLARNHKGSSILVINTFRPELYSNEALLTFYDKITTDDVFDSLCSILDDLVMPYKIEKLPPIEGQTIRYKMVMAFEINLVRDDSGKRFIIQEGIVENKIPVPSPFLHN
jgi:hypothetical protein